MKKREKQGIREGLSFGLTSAIITTLGLFIGLSSTTSNKLIIIGGILTISIADSLSDAFGIHVSQESDKKNSSNRAFKATVAAFFTKFFFGLTFLIPLILFDLKTATYVAIIYGMALTGFISYFIADIRNEPKVKTIFNHLVMMIIVIILTKSVGTIIESIFGTI